MKVLGIHQNTKIPKFLNNLSNIPVLPKNVRVISIVRKYYRKPKALLTLKSVTFLSKSRKLVVSEIKLSFLFLE